MELFISLKYKMRLLAHRHSEVEAASETGNLWYQLEHKKHFKLQLIKKLYLINYCY